MAEQRLRLRLGVFVAATLVTLSALVILFGSAPNLFATKSRYTVLFPEAPGIAAGTPIRKSGVRIGEVTKLDLDPATGQVRVQMGIDPKYPPRTNEEATISRGLLNGDTAIDFLPKLGPDGQPLPTGDNYPAGSELMGVPPITPRSILTPASGVIASAQASLDRMVTSFERLEKVAPQLEKTLAEYEGLARDIRRFVPELKKTNEAIQGLIGPTAPAPPPPLPPGAVMAQDDRNPDNLRTLIHEIRTLLATVRPAIEDIRGAVRRAEPDVTAAAKSARTTLDRAAVTFDAVNELLSPENRKQFDELLRTLNGVAVNILKVSAGFQTLLAEAERTVKNFDKRTELTADVLADLRALTRPLAERSDTLVKDVSESAGQLNKILTEVRELVRAFARENGTIQKLLTDSNLYNSLDAAAVSLARVLARAEKVARDLEVFSDKVARHPESIGLGGVVRPSSGLKESPFAPMPPGVQSYRPDWPPAIPARSSTTGGGAPLVPVGDGTWRPAPVEGSPIRP
jgi:phospholipid/cholesterol/gamma-HCH transport system substrate-binding protein